MSQYVSMVVVFEGSEYEQRNNEHKGDTCRKVELYIPMKIKHLLVACLLFAVVVAMMTPSCKECCLLCMVVEEVGRGARYSWMRILW